MEELNSTLPGVTESNRNSDKESESLTDKLNKPISRRGFLKGLGVVFAAGTLASCTPGRKLEADDEDKNFRDNIRELNRQFAENEKQFLTKDKYFNYERYIQEFPGFESYKDYIEENAIDISRTYGVHPNVMRALGSSIVASNMNNQDPITKSDKFTQRVGVMQFVPINVIKKYKERIDKEFVDSVDNMTKPENNIKYGMKYLAELLRDFRNDGENKDMMQLILAYYYGQNNLLEQIKHNREIKNDNYLWSNYSKYINTLRVLGINTEFREVSMTERNVEEVFDLATQYWHESKFDDYRNIFFQQVNEYHKKALVHNPDIMKAELLAVFLAIARAESKGGIKKEVEKPDPNTPKDLLAVGWYQIVPRWQHLEEYNLENATSYSYDDLVNNDVVSIKVGIWTLMKYSHDVNIVDCMKRFKGGWRFGDFPDDYLWWNRVSYGLKLLLKKNPFNMEYIDYYKSKLDYDANGEIIGSKWLGPYPAANFESSGDVGVMNPDPKE